MCSRSSLYCSDVVKMIGCPVIHVNGDYPEVSVVVYIHALHTAQTLLHLFTCTG